MSEIDAAAARIAQASEALLQATGEISAASNRLSLGLGGTQQTVNTTNGASTLNWILGIFGVFALVTAISACLVMWAFRAADVRVMDERATNQRVVNEDLLDRVRLLEVKVKKLEHSE